jgi:hypothetical protein
VPQGPISIEHVRVNALAVVPDPQTKLPFVIADFHFDLPRLGVPACIAQRLGCDSVDFVSENWMEVSRRAFHLHPNIRAIPASLVRREFFRQSAYSQGQVIVHDCGQTQPVHSRFQKQASTLICGKTVAEAYANAAYAFDTRHAGRKLWAEQSRVSGLVRDASNCRQMEVNRGWRQ